MKPLKKKATYADLRAVPEHFVAEMLDGELYATPRPAMPHAHASSVVMQKLGSFHRSGPGGWLIVFEPELHFGNDVLVPDIAGWRRERLPTLPAVAYMTLVPDWVCEVLSPATERIDCGRKLQCYAREGVVHVWLLDPIQQALEVLALDDGRWVSQGRYQGEALVRAAPFDTVELELGSLWS
jgi:Uma2 family endonuclease